jgi:hypothetical protein
MDRNEYAYAPLSAAQYDAIITAGTMQGTSPLHGAANYDALIRASRAANCDPRVALSWMLWEDHFGSDPGGGVELAKVYNFGGIKWVGQAGAFDSGIPYPINEGVGTYAGFPDAGAWFRELYRTLDNEYCGPYFRAGDLANCASVYITGRPNSGHGQERVDQWQYYRRHFPPGGDPVADGVYGEDLIAVMAAHEGEASSDGTLDPWNGPHLWQGWCEASVEGVDTAAGLVVVHRGSAAEKGDAVEAQGLMRHSWPPEHGANVCWGRTFDPQGHICKWDDDKGMFLSTLFSPSRIGYFYSDGWRDAVRGWFRSPGVVAARRAVAPPPPPPPAVDSWVIDGNPYGPIPVRMPFFGRWDALNTMGKPLDHPGAVNPAGLALPTLGYPVEPETTLATGRRVQRFERAWLATDKGSDPFDCVALMLNERP